MCPLAASVTPLGPQPLKWPIRAVSCWNQILDLLYLNLSPSLEMAIAEGLVFHRANEAEAV